MSNPRPLRIGIGGPVGSGKTMCVLRLCQWLKDEVSLAVITVVAVAAVPLMLITHNGQAG